MKKQSLTLIVILATLVSSCAKNLTDDIVTKHGTRILNASYDDTWRAVEEVFVLKDYKIALKNKEKGSIITDQKQTGAVGGGGAARGLYKQYEAKIVKISENKTKVTLRPSVYRGDQDISGDKVWVIKGKNGEIAAWNRIFKKIKSRL